MKGNLALCASGFRHKAWVTMLGMQDGHQGKRCLENDRSRPHGILFLQANERRRGEDDHMAILLDSFERNSQS